MIEKLTAEYNLKPRIQCNTSTMFSIHKKQRLYQQSEYSQSNKRESISSQLGRSSGSVQQSVIKPKTKGKRVKLGKPDNAGKIMKKCINFFTFSLSLSNCSPEISLPSGPSGISNREPSLATA